jgi:hypothetical protein
VEIEVYRVNVKINPSHTLINRFKAVGLRGAFVTGFDFIKSAFKDAFSEGCSFPLRYL